MLEKLSFLGNMAILGAFGLVLALAFTLVVFILVVTITTSIDAFRAFRRGMTLQQYYAAFERNRIL